MKQMKWAFIKSPLCNAMLCTAKGYFNEAENLASMSKKGLFSRGIHTIDFPRKTTNLVPSDLQILDVENAWKITILVPDKMVSKT